MRPPTRTTNPYVVQLVDACRAHTQVRYFGWWRGLFGRYDVLHLHWPEVMLRRQGRAARWAAELRFAALMLRVTVLGTPVVRTLHNVEPHESGSRRERWLLSWCRRRTRYWILLNAATTTPGPGPIRVIPHGHYRDWYPAAAAEPVAGRLLFFGLIRPYKGVDLLLKAFAALTEPGVSLDVVGRVTTSRLRSLVEEACRGDRRIRSLLDHADDATLAARIEQAQLVVLPYRELHNSGALLLALSLDRPVLVPESPTTRAIAAEVGPGWVLSYHGELTADVLAAAVAATAQRPADRPRLSGRDWPTVAQAHLEVYQAARRAGRRTGGRGSTES